MYRTFLTTVMMLCGGLCGWRSVRLALSGTADSAEYHFRLWQEQEEKAGGKPDELERALALNPRYSEAWIARGLNAETAGRHQLAEASLLRAAAIDRQYPPLWTLANFYLRAGRLPQFWTWARRAAGMAYDPAALFQLFWRTGADAHEILERGIPPLPRIRRAYLDYLLRSDRLDAAEAVSAQVAEAGDPGDLDLLLRYCDAALAHGQAGRARAAWNGLARRRLIPYGILEPSSGASLTNGELSAAPLGRGFDWRTVPGNGVACAIDVDLREMAVFLSGKQPESGHVAEQYLPIVPGLKYRFRYRYRTRGLAAGSGLGWSVVEARTGAGIAAATVPGLTEDWREEELVFSTPGGCDLIRISLVHRRTAGRTRAEGSAAFSRFSLEPRANGRMMLPWALGTLLLFAVLAFASTEQWALSIFQAGVFLLGVWCAARRSLRWHPLGFAFAGIPALAGLQLWAGSTVYRFPTVNAVVNHAACFVLFLVSLATLAIPGVRRAFPRAVLYAGSGVALLSTAQYFTSGGAIYWWFQPAAGRAFGPFVDPDHYAAFVELILPLAIYEALRDRNKLWIHTAMAGALYASVIASASRMGACLATLEILLLPWLGRRRGAGPVIALSVACAGIATMIVGPQALWGRFQDADPLRYRRQIAISTWHMIEQRPWLGVGLGNYSTVYPEFALFDIGRRVDHAHNDWAEWTAEGGIPLLLLMLAVAGASFGPAMRSGWAMGIYAVFAHSLVDFPLQIPALAALLITFVAALCAGAAPGYTKQK